jgi:N-carbamoyl-L-amino-acid hydrolase
VLLEIDVRDTRLEPRNRTMEAIQTAITEICTRRGVLWDVTVLNADPPATCDPLLISVVEQSCQALGVPYRHLISRAYHDTLFMSHICPVTMIFVPCQGGISHHPDEYAAPEDIARGIEVLAHTLARLAE